MTSLNAIERPKTLKERALIELRSAITFGQFKPGDRLVERVLCERLGVSRTVIRECIRHLESERLVKVVPNSGPTVTSLSVDEVKEIYDLRQMLECRAVEACAMQADQDAIDSLRSSCDHIADAMNQGNLVTVLAETKSFYETIFLSGGQTVSWDLEEQLNSRVALLRTMTLQSKGREKTGPQNLSKIVDAIENRDREAAVRACKKHVTEALVIALSELGRQVRE